MRPCKRVSIIRRLIGEAAGGDLEVVIDRTFPLSDAHVYMAES